MIKLDCRNCLEVITGDDRRKIAGLCKAGFGIRNLSCPHCGEQALVASDPKTGENIDTIEK